MHKTPPRHQASRAILIAAALGALGAAAWSGLSSKPSRDATRVTRSASASRSELERTPREPLDREHDAARPIAGAVHDAAGRAIAQANVCVFEASDVCCGSARCTVTNAEGRFSLGERASSTSMLLASAAGYLSALRALSDDHAGVALSLTLQRGGQSVSGTVVDASGGPIPGAMVTLQPRGTEAPTVVLADARGVFTGQVAVQELDALAQAEAYSSARVAVHAPASGVTLILAPAAALVGKVVDAEHEQPLEDVTVMVVSADAPGEPLSAASDAAGEFRVANLLPGSYQVVARSARWQSDVLSIELELAADSDPIVLRARAAATLTGSVLVAGEPCREGAVELRSLAGTEYQSIEGGLVHFDGLRPGKFRATISCQGALSRDELVLVGSEPLLREWELSRGLSLGGRVETAQHQAVPNARVSVEPVGDTPASSAGCVTDDRGAFLCQGLSTGEYDCSVIGPFGAASAPQRVVIRETPGPELLLIASAAGTIRVAVRAPDDASRSIKVLMRGLGGAHRASLEGDEFVFTAVPLGVHEVYVDSPSAEAGSSAEARLERDGEVVRVSLNAPALESISGQVLDALGAPLPDVWVRAVAADPFATDSDRQAERPALTDASGAFKLVGLAPGSYAVHAKHGSGEGVGPTAFAGQTNVVIRLEPPGALLVNVSLPSGQPAPDFRISCQRDGGEPRESAGALGHGLLSRLSPGSYRVEIEASQGAASGDVTVRAGERASLDLRLDGSATGDRDERDERESDDERAP